MEENEGDKDADIKNKVFIRENINCYSQIELPYYSDGNFKDICIHCGSGDFLVKSPAKYPKCGRCNDKADVLRTKRKSILQEDLQQKKKKK